MLTSSGLKQNLINAAGSLVAAALQKGNPPTVAAPNDEPTAVAAVNHPDRTVLRSAANQQVD